MARHTLRQPHLLAAACAMLVVALAVGSHAEAPQTQSPATGTISISTGVYSADQAERGEQTFANNCAGCHATSKFTESAFHKAWNGKTLFDLYDLVSETMPEDFPGALSPAEYAEALAYILKLNRAPAGEADLPPDPAALRNIRLDLNK